MIKNKIDIYSNEKKWKIYLLSFAAIIGFFSIFLTNLLVKELKNEERKKSNYGHKQLNIL